MNKREWIRGEIAEWQKEGVIEAELAEKLCARYAENGTSRSWGAMLAGAVGALLMAIGLVAIIAAKWDNFGDILKILLASLPVVIGGVLAFVAHKKGVSRMSFWEPLGLFWMIVTIVATILIADVIECGTLVDDLLLVIALLTYPIVWITKSIGAMGFWPIIGVSWGCIVDASWPHFFGALGIMALSIPTYLAFLHRKPAHTALIIGQTLIGLVYAIAPAFLCLIRLDHSPQLTGQTVFYICWANAAVIALCGLFLKQQCWPKIGIVIAWIVAMWTPFMDELFSVPFVLALLFAIAIAVIGVRKLRLDYTNIGASLFLWLVLFQLAMSERTSIVFNGLIIIAAGVVLTLINIKLVKYKRMKASA